VDQGSARADTEATISKDEVARLVAHAEVLGDPAGWAQATTYESLALAILDAVWSIGVRYASVMNVLDRYREARLRERADPERDTPQNLADVVDGVGGPEAFAGVVSNRQRTSARGGILKAEAVRLAAGVLVAAGIATPQELAAASPGELAAVRDRWMKVAGQRSGISWDYFLMLSGSQGVKADRMVCRFVAQALGVDELSVSPRQAHALVTAVAAHLDVDVSQLDYAIWLHQSGNSPI
jgi:hypothetical protein